eukprot:CAMPEP_0178542512 /NCGR_PEP_ID=MMETSP0697-20121206/2100_1 /TAXON_ID=265572 /ORGANISM="Extubocellulus spinifer, Strain CCMP396" /LENGTH=337 /DNA_ID=CAMNT_0020174921 /DNA_START=65 /DNA_END=1079 /DNA_ORIENTATION=-
MQGLKVVRRTAVPEPLVVPWLFLSNTAQHHNDYTAARCNNKASATTRDGGRIRNRAERKRVFDTSGPRARHDTSKPDAYPHRLLKLDLSRNNLHAIPSEMGRLILLIRNNLHAIPSEMGRLILLRDLNLSFNRLQVVSGSIASCIRLKSLDLSNNEIARIPPELAACSMLETLDVSNNRLDYCPEELSGLPALYELNLSGNITLTEIPSSLCNIPTLKHISCNGNDSLFPADVQTNSTTILWCLQIQHEHAEKVTVAEAKCEELKSKASAAAEKERILEEQLDALKNKLEALEAERPTKYLERKKRFLAIKARWKQRFCRVGGILRRPARAAKVKAD